MADEIEPSRQLRAAGRVIIMLNKRIAELEAENERMRVAGQDLWSFIVVNAPNSLTKHPRFDKVTKAWESR